MAAHDLLYVRHICDAAKQLAEYVQGRRRQDLDRDPLLRDGLIRQIEIIGEAASHLSEEFRGRSAQTPWPDIVAMRHRLIHGYFSVNLDLVWETAVRDAPELFRVLSPLLAGGDGGDE
jgi:uncharacterized protein with HEPN domain